MKIIPRKHKMILNFIGDREVKKEEIVNHFKNWNYMGYGSDRYIGAILKRMVQNRLIERSRHGFYQIRSKHAEEINNQGKLF